MSLVVFGQGRIGRVNERRASEFHQRGDSRRSHKTSLLWALAATPQRHGAAATGQRHRALFARTRIVVGGPRRQSGAEGALARLERAHRTRLPWRADRWRIAVAAAAAVVVCVVVVVVAGWLCERSVDGGVAGGGAIGLVEGGSAGGRGAVVDAVVVVQRWVIAIGTKIQLPDTLPITLNCAIGIINWSNWVKGANYQLIITNYWDNIA